MPSAVTSWPVGSSRASAALSWSLSSPGAILGDQAQANEQRLAGIILTAWASIIGYLSAEIFGSLTSLVAEPGTLYRAHIHAVMASMGYLSRLAEAATQPGGHDPLRR